MIRTFDEKERARFAALVKAQRLDERLAADEASRLAKGWLTDLPAAWPRELLSRALAHKLAGYNAEVHTWAARVQRAVAAAKLWLDGAEAVRFELSDLTLGEYFLLSWCRSREVPVHASLPLEEPLETLLARHPPRCTRDDFEAFEFDLAQTLLNAGRRTAPIPAARTLFIATMETYLNPLIPVMESLHRRGERSLLFVPPEAAAWPGIGMVPHHVARVTPADLMTHADAGEFQSTQKRVIAWLKKAEPRLTERFTTLGVNLWPLLAPDIHEFARIYLPAAMWLLAAGQRLAADHGIRAVVCARLRRCTDSALALGVQRAGGRCILVPHGHVGESPARRAVDGSFDTADTICVWGREQRRQLLAKNDGVRAERILVTGNPAWDALAKRPREERADIRARIAPRLGWPAASASDPWLVYTTQADAAAQAPGIIRAALAMPGLRLVLKLHPRESDRAYRAALVSLDKSRAAIVSSHAPPLHDLLAAADALVTFHSTTNIESLLLGTPVITAALADLAGVDRLIDLERFGLPLATDEPALADIFQSLADSPESFHESYEGVTAAAARLLVANHATADAADRVAALIAGASATAEAA